MIDLDPYAVVEAVKIRRASFKNPPKTVEEYLYTLTKQQLTVSVSRLRKLWHEVYIAFRKIPKLAQTTLS